MLFNECAGINRGGGEVNSGLSLSGVRTSLRLLMMATEYRFLGMFVWLFRNSARATLMEDLKRMLEAVGKAPVTRQQTLRLYKLGICPRVAVRMRLYHRYYTQ